MEMRRAKAPSAAGRDVRPNSPRRCHKCKAVAWRLNAIDTLKRKLDRKVTLAAAARAQ